MFCSRISHLVGSANLKLTDDIRRLENTSSSCNANSSRKKSIVQMSDLVRQQSSSATDFSLASSYYNYDDTNVNVYANNERMFEQSFVMSPLPPAFQLVTISCKKELPIAATTYATATNEPTENATTNAQKGDNTSQKRHRLLKSAFSFVKHGVCKRFRSSQSLQYAIVAVLLLVASTLFILSVSKIAYHVYSLSRQNTRLLSELSSSSAAAASAGGTRGGRGHLMRKRRDLSFEASNVKGNEWSSEKMSAMYEIDTASFYDADGDGTGDLAGVLAKLDFIRRTLRVKSILVRETSASLGQLGDFVRLVQERDIKVTLELDIVARLGGDDKLFDEQVSIMRKTKYNLTI